MRGGRQGLGGMPGVLCRCRQGKGRLTRAIRLDRGLSQRMGILKVDALSAVDRRQPENVDEQPLDILATLWTPPLLFRPTILPGLSR